MKKLVLSIAVTAIFLFALCHTAAGGGSSDAGLSYGVDRSSLAVTEINAQDDGSDEFDSRDKYYEDENDPVKVEVVSTDDHGIEHIGVFFPISDDEDDDLDIHIVLPSGTEFIKQITAIISNEGEDEGGIKITLPDSVRVIGEVHAVDPDGLELPEFELEVVPEEAQFGNSGDTGEDSISTSPVGVDEDAVSGDDLIDDDYGLGVKQGVNEFDVNVLYGDPEIGASAGHCSMVGGAQANAAAFLLMALALMPIARKRSE